MSVGQGCKTRYPLLLAHGLVTPASARWGRYRGTLQNVSHQQMVDATGKDCGAFDVRAFYVRLVGELAEMGF